jgi:hypothetical protein
MFNFFKDKDDRFSIFNESTWGLASGSVFTISGRTVKNNDSDFTERELVKAIDDVIRGISSNQESRENIKRIERNKVIERLVDNLSKGLPFTDSIGEMIRWLNSGGRKPPFIPFDILNPETWDDASDSVEIIWNEKSLPDKDGNAITEKDAVDLVRYSFNFLERNGDIVPLDKKISSITKLFNRMENPEYYAEQERKIQKELDDSIPDGLFDPRNPETYKFARVRPLTINGVRILNYYTKSDGKEYGEPETEKSFSNIVAALLKSSGLSTPEEKQNYIDDYIKRTVAECTPKKLTTYGGYGFSEAQLEVLDGLHVETIEKIGKIMSSGTSGSKLKQEIFNSLAIDGHWVVELRHHDPYFEEDIMYDFYLGFEGFTSEQEIYDFFNCRPYLKKHHELKEKVIRNAIEYIEEERDVN